jgi:hypothetical protein
MQSTKTDFSPKVPDFSPIFFWEGLKVRIKGLGFGFFYKGLGLGKNAVF